MPDKPCSPTVFFLGKKKFNKGEERFMLYLRNVIKSKFSQPK